MTTPSSAAYGASSAKDIAAGLKQLFLCNDVGKIDRQIIALRAVLVRDRLGQRRLDIKEPGHLACGGAVEKDPNLRLLRIAVQSGAPSGVPDHLLRFFILHPEHDAAILDPADEKAGVIRNT